VTELLVLYLQLLHLLLHVQLLLLVKLQPLLQLPYHSSLLLYLPLPTFEGSLPLYTSTLPPVDALLRPAGSVLHHPSHPLCFPPMGLQIVLLLRQTDCQLLIPPLQVVQPPPQLTIKLLPLGW
jgi:hypothetical protein